jgi:hypothetical protein
MRIGMAKGFPMAACVHPDRRRATKGDAGFASALSDKGAV